MTQPVVPLRPLAVTEVLDAAVRVVRRNARAVYSLTLPLAIVQTLISALLLLAGIGSTAALGAQSLVDLFVAGAFATLLAGLVAPVVGADVLGRRLGAGPAVRRIGRRVLPLFVLAVGVTLAQDVGLVALLVGGAWLWGIWAVAAPALVLEERGVFAALGRSFQLTRRHFWRVWGTRALGWFATRVLAALITFPVMLIADAVTGVAFGDRSLGAAPAVYVTLISIGQLLSVTLTAPITAAIDVLIYTDLRMRVEGMDVVLALDAARVPGPYGAGRPTAPVTAW